MRVFNGENMLTLKEASEKYTVPISWIRKQLGKPRLPNKKVVRVVKFPADKNYYVFEAEMEELVKPVIWDPKGVEEEQRAYEKDPEYYDPNVGDFVWKDEEEGKE